MKDQTIKEIEKILHDAAYKSFTSGFLCGVLFLAIIVGVFWVFSHGQ